MPDDEASAADQAATLHAVETMLAGGWRPSRHWERTWVRHPVTVQVNEDRDQVELLADAETMPMTADEEQVLITRQWSDA